MSEVPEVYQSQPAVPVADGVSIRPTGLVIERELSISEWAVLGDRLGVLGKAIQFAIGDWLNYGEIKYGETYSQFSELTGYKVETLQNIKFVAGRVEISRRRESLTFAHHAEVAGLVPSEQDYWLDCAEKEDWSSKRLRDELHPDLDDLFNEIECPNCGYKWGDA